MMFVTTLICLVLVLSGCTPTTSTPITHQLSTSVVPSGSGSISPSGGLFQDKVTLVATPAQNYEFSGWAGVASGNTNPLTVTMDSDKQIVAQFKRLQSTVQVTSNPSDGGTVSPANGIFDTGSTATFTVTPNSGYRFVNWGGDATENTNPLSILINNDKILTANFIKQFTLIVTADPNAGTVNQKGGIFDSGTQVSVTATPVFPYVFQSWSGTDNNGVNPTTVTMITNKSVTANFVKLAAGEPTSLGKGYAGGDQVTIPLDLVEGTWVQGEVTGNPLPVTAYIQDPGGKTIKDFGSTSQSNFTFYVDVSGTYTVFMRNNNGLWPTDYHLTYTIYK